MQPLGVVGSPQLPARGPVVLLLWVGPCSLLGFRLGCAALCFLHRVRVRGNREGGREGWWDDLTSNSGSTYTVKNTYIAF